MKIKRVVEREIEIDTDSILEEVKDRLESYLDDFLYDAISNNFIGEDEDWEWFSKNGYDELYNKLANSIKIKVTKEKPKKDLVENNTLCGIVIESIAETR